LKRGFALTGFATTNKFIGINLTDVAIKTDDADGAAGIGIVFSDGTNYWSYSSASAPLHAWDVVSSGAPTSFHTTIATSPPVRQFVFPTPVSKFTGATTYNLDVYINNANNGVRTTTLTKGFGVEFQVLKGTASIGASTDA